MNVVVLIDGREAVPVRAIPLLTNWEVQSPDVLVDALARKALHESSFESLVACRREAGTIKAIAPVWWENFASRQLSAISEGLTARQDSGEITREEGYQRWRRASLEALPASVFVWKDELAECFRREYEDNRWARARVPADAAEQVRPDFDPFISGEVAILVMEGFEHTALSAQQELSLGEQLDERCAMSDGFLRAALGDRSWGEWRSHPVVQFKHAVKLLAQIDPDATRGKTPPAWLQARVRNIATADPRNRSLMDWIRDFEWSQMEWTVHGPEEVREPTMRSDPASDRTRRLQLLREMGGDVTWLAGDWSVSGLTDLIKRENEDGRSRTSPKTVRDDLKKAAQEERDAKRGGGTGAGMFPGIGR